MLRSDAGGIFGAGDDVGAGNLFGHTFAMLVAAGEGFHALSQNVSVAGDPGGAVAGGAIHEFSRFDAIRKIAAGVDEGGGSIRCAGRGLAGIGADLGL